MKSLLTRADIAGVRIRLARSERRLIRVRVWVSFNSYFRGYNLIIRLDRLYWRAYMPQAQRQ